MILDGVDAGVTKERTFIIISAYERGKFEETGYRKKVSSGYLKLPLKQRCYVWRNWQKKEKKDLSRDKERSASSESNMKKKEGEMGEGGK